jgi:hypothetical protein
MSSTGQTLNDLYPKTPWWTNLVAVFLTALFTIIATSVNIPKSSGGPASFGALVTDTALFLPHALILFGILADMFTAEGVYSIPSLIGILSIFLNKFIDLAWLAVAALIDKFGKVAEVGGVSVPGTTQRGGSVSNYPGCYVQGFEIDMLKSKYSSQTLVVTITILAYYIFDLLMNKGILMASIPIFVSVIIVVMQMSSMSAGGCFQQNGLLVTTLASLANGLVIGGGSYGIMEAVAPNRLPSKALPSYPRVDVSDLKTDDNGNLVDANGMSWNILPDGTAVPNTCPGTNNPLGSGNAATNANCPGAVTVN